jgi:hypothetical protein
VRALGDLEAQEEGGVMTKRSWVLVVMLVVGAVAWAQMWDDRYAKHRMWTEEEIRSLVGVDRLIHRPVEPPTEVWSGWIQLNGNILGEPV